MASRFQLMYQEATRKSRIAKCEKKLQEIAQKRLDLKFKAIAVQKELERILAGG